MTIISIAGCLAKLAACASLLCPAAALAAGIVTLCDSDVQHVPGLPGLNLRDAVAGGGTVTFACKPGTTIRITRTHAIPAPTVVDGDNAVGFKTDSAHAMFTVSHTLTLRGRTLSNGFIGLPTLSGPTGIVAGPGVLILEHSQVRNTANPFHLDTIRAHHCVFEQNSGPAVIWARVALIHHSSFAGNNAVAVRSPLVPEAVRPSVAVVMDSTFTRNESGLWWVGTLHVARSTFTDNDNKGRPGGAIRIRGSARVEHSGFDRNHASAGGAIWMDGGSLTLRRAVFHDNVAATDGGAIGVGEIDEAAIVSQYATFTGNTAVRGGALKLGIGGTRIALQGGPNTFARNRASQGGAIYADFGRIQLARAVFSDNQASTEGGAVFSSRRGSPVAAVFANSLLVRNTAPQGAAVSGTAVVLINSTVASNQGVAIALQPLSHFSDAGARGEIDLRNSVVSNNAGGNCSTLPPGHVAKGNGHNLQFPGNECGSAAATADPMLDALYVPQPGSPAFAGGDNLICLASPIDAKDIYGASRPQGASCAVGAVEGDIDPRLFIRLLWRLRDTLQQQYSFVASRLGK